MSASERNSQGYVEALIIKSNEKQGAFLCSLIEAQLVPAMIQQRCVLEIRLWKLTCYHCVLRGEFVLSHLNPTNPKESKSGSFLTDKVKPPPAPKQRKAPPAAAPLPVILQHEAFPSLLIFPPSDPALRASSLTLRISPDRADIS